MQQVLVFKGAEAESTKKFETSCFSNELQPPIPKIFFLRVCVSVCVFCFCFPNCFERKCKTRLSSGISAARQLSRLAQSFKVEIFQ